MVSDILISRFCRYTLDHAFAKDSRGTAVFPSSRGEFTSHEQCTARESFGEGIPGIYISLFSLDQRKLNSTINLVFNFGAQFYFSRRIKRLLKLGETEIFDYLLISVLFQYSVHYYLEIK